MWKVTATVQAKGNDPVEMVWQKDGDKMGVMVCVSQLFAHEDKNQKYTPELLAIKIEKV